ncbi:hypothetical protein [Bulleidia sp. zg-1006]|uniref:hypothetical protein n=1 Tax=Bulleidia sp. zg-1006 TaxID=2806552 RepID=UPI00193A402B|nr:hypothetical protein [Bulleidia sp. zg-1006]QRG86925.1 hypothetical protein JOS54_01000 [Bulleidia sp. zg-1006]
MKKINALGMSALVAVMLLNGCGTKQSATVAEKNDGQTETITTSNSKPQPEITKKEEVKQSEKKVEAKETAPAQKEVSTKKEEVSKVSTSTSTKKNNSTAAKVKSSKSNVQTKKSTSNTNSKGKNTNKGNTSSNSKGKTKPVKKPSGATNTSKPKPKACPYKNYDADGNCETHKKVCMTSEQVYQKYVEWAEKHNHYGRFTYGDSDFDGCHVIFTNDGSFKAGED